MMKKKEWGHVFDFVWILIAISKPCQGNHSYQVQVQSNQPSFILKAFSQSDKRALKNANDSGRMNVALVPAVSYVAVGLSAVT